MKESIPFILNGKKVNIHVDGERFLLTVLRKEFGLTGTKYGCGEGYCGACTVLMNNKAVKSCQTTMEEAKGKEIVTIEGLAKGKDIHPLQKAFIEHDATQCGFCTPGMILTAYSLLKENPKPSETEIIYAMDDNLCRCGSYRRIIEAIQNAAKEMMGGETK
ncbi:MAG: (2Fe-2S)-binding protein [Deltaproteobacteria bacterium]|nr:(2Fe-2S)-binding protein [Deltaproteobacteria bacterium]